MPAVKPGGFGADGLTAKEFAAGQNGIPLAMFSQRYQTFSGRGEEPDAQRTFSEKKLEYVYLIHGVSHY